MTARANAVAVDPLRLALGIILSLLAMTVVACSPDSQSHLQKRQIIERIHSELWSKGNLDVVDEFYSTDLVAYQPEGLTRGREEMKARVVAHRTAFPDWTETVEEIVVDGDLAASRFTSSGTNLGLFRGRPATGKKVEFTEVAFFRFADGKVIEQRVYPDRLTMLQQLGYIGND